MTQRRTFNDGELLASLICEKLGIPMEHQKLMTVAQARSLVHGDHYPIPFADEGPTEFWNCVVLSIMAHRVKTATIDVPNIAKGKRLRNREMVRRHNEVAKLDPVAAACMFPAVARLKRRKRAIPQRANPWPKRSFQRRRT